MQSATTLPGGTVTLLFTDIEGSTKLWDEHPEAMRLALSRHDTLAASVIEQRAGAVVKSRGEGDSLFAVFSRATDAVAAASALQQAYLAEHWPTPTPLRVRMALHTAEADLRDGDYYGAAVNRCARLRSIAHGGQVLLSLAAAEVVREALPEGSCLRDLGLVRLRDLAQPEHVFQLAHPDLPGEFPPVRSLDALPNNLPVQLTNFIGREEALSEVKRLLTTTHLLTLTGAGGIGKTRLALQVAADLLEQYPDGVWLVELAPLADPALVPQMVASTLGVREEPGRPLTATLTDYLRAKSLLLVLDNCEHLLSASAQLVDSLLRACPRLRVLASSREGLGIAGERSYRVPSLTLPDPTHLPPVERLTEYGAVRLFVERAVFSQPGFAVTDQNASSVVQVCQRLDGIPLAIELAAARVKALPVEKLSERLDDMFRLLTGGSRTALPRQQTLRALIDWSYNLLSEGEQTTLRRLAVFAGGWTLEAAEAVCSDGEVVGSWGGEANGGAHDLTTSPPRHLAADDVLDLLTSLVDKSLVAYDEQGGGGRYRLLETVRQYARDRLLEAGEGGAVRGQHRDWYLGLADRAEPELTRKDQRLWLDRLEEDLDNFRAALEWALEREPADALRLASALELFWTARGYWAEGREAFARALERGADAPAEVRAKTLGSAGEMARCQVELERSKELSGKSLELSRALGDKLGVARSLITLGSVAWRQGDYEAARASYEESLAIGTEIGHEASVAASLEGLGWVALHQDDVEAARDLFEESLAIHRARGNKRGIAHALATVGVTAREQGDAAASRAHYEESVAIFRELGDKGGAAHWLNNLGYIARDQGDYEAARAFHEGCLAIWREIGDKVGIAQSLEGLGLVASHQGDYAAARAFHVESLALFRETGHKHSIAVLLTNLGHVTWAQGEYDAARAFLDEGLAISQETGNQWQIAIVMGELGYVACAQGEYDRARKCHEESLALFRQKRSPVRLKKDIARSLHGLGNVAQAQGDYEQARARYEESLTISREIGARQGMAAAFEGLAKVATAEGAAERAARLFGAAEALREEIRAPLAPAERADYDASVAATRAQLGEEAFAAAWAEGRTLSPERALCVALEEGGMVSAPGRYSATFSAG